MSYYGETNQEDLLYRELLCACKALPEGTDPSSRTGHADHWGALNGVMDALVKLGHAEYARFKITSENHHYNGMNHTEANIAAIKMKMMQALGRMGSEFGSGNPAYDLSQFNTGGGQAFMGDYVGNDKITTNIQGNNAKNVIKSTISNSFNMSLASQKIDILKQILDKDYQGSDKEVLAGQLEEIKSLAAKKSNYPKIRELLGGIMTKTSEFATIGVACLEVFKLFTGTK